MSDSCSILLDPTLEPWQKRNRLARCAEAGQPAPGLNERTRPYFEAGVLCDLFEGPAPYRPRYILPDYERLLRQGSEFLELDAPKDLFEAVGLLLAAYRFVPSITGLPVFLGHLDALLEPYWDSVDEATARRLLRHFLVQIDRTLPDAFVHANLGPQDSRVGLCILELETEAKRAVPNLSLKVGPETSRALKLAAVRCALETGKPYFVNHPLLAGALPHPYGLASCYNTLPLGGGSHTLIRLNLARLAEGCSLADFLEQRLPAAVDALLEVIEARVRFLVEESGFFEASWLVREGLIQLDRFTAMAGMLGLHEAVASLGAGRMGHVPEADALAEHLIFRLRDLVKARPLPHCAGTDGFAGLHAQSGIAGDQGATPGVRIQVGQEPELPAQVRLQARLQAAFDTGVSDILCLDPSARQHPEGALRIVEGAIAAGLRILSIGTSDAEVVRVSGYLVKRRDLERIHRGENLREESAVLAEEAVRNQRVLARQVRSLG